MDAKRSTVGENIPCSGGMSSIFIAQHMPRQLNKKRKQLAEFLKACLWQGLLLSPEYVLSMEGKRLCILEKVHTSASESIITFPRVFTHILWGWQIITPFNVLGLCCIKKIIIFLAQSFITYNLNTSHPSFTEAKKKVWRYLATFFFPAGCLITVKKSNFGLPMTGMSLFLGSSGYSLLYWQSLYLHYSPQKERYLVLLLIGKNPETSLYTESFFQLQVAKRKNRMVE